MNNIAESRG